MSLPVPAPAFTGPARCLLGTLSSRPGLFVLSGHPESSRLSHYFLAAPLLRGEVVLFLDAANCFNPYRLVVFAEQCRRPPAQFLGRVRISRAFTCFQLAELIERTPAAARRFRARRVVVTGMPDIFDDEELPAAEAKAAFTRSLDELRRWPEQGLTALIFSDAPPRLSPLGAWLRGELERQATEAYRLEESPAGLCLREAKTREVEHGTHGRDFSPADRADPGALRQVPARPAPRRSAGA